MEQPKFPGKKINNNDTPENLNPKATLPSIDELFNSFHEYEDLSSWREEGEDPPEEFVLQNNKASLENGKLMKKFMASFDEKKLLEALESPVSRTEALNMIDVFLCNIPRFRETSRAYKIFLDRVTFCFLKESLSKEVGEENLSPEELKEISRKKLRIYGILIERLKREKDPRYGFMVRDIKKSMEHADMGNFIIESELGDQFGLIHDVFVITHNFSDEEYQKKISNYFIPMINKDLEEDGAHFNSIKPRLVFGEILKDAYAEKISQSCGIPFNRAEKMVTEWVYGEKMDVMKNLRITQEIEAHIPGGVKRLNETYNIEFFSRYPTKLLEAQLNEEDLQQPYGVVIYAKDDHNGAFSKDTRSDERTILGIGQKEAVLGNIYNETRGHHGLKVFEAGSKIDLARIFIQLDKKYGKENKIDFAILGAHGSVNGMSLGKAWRGNVSDLRIDDFDQKPGMGKKPGVINAQKFFKKDPTFVLLSCSTGADQGFGERLSKEYNATVVAPKIPTAVKKIDIAYDPLGNFKFDAEYYDKDSERVIQSGR